MPEKYVWDLHGYMLELPRGSMIKLDGGFYNRGFCDNYYTLFGPHWLQRWLLPFPVYPCFSVDEARHPIPSKKALKMLKKKVDDLLKE